MSEPQKTFVDPTEDDFVAPRPAGTNPATGKQFTTGEVAREFFPKTSAEDIEPSAVKRGFAALGGALQEPVLGAVEKVQMAFPGEGPAGQKRIQDIAAERAQRRQHLRTLEESPAGMFGATVGKGLPYALATSPGAAASVGFGTGFLGGGPDQPTGLGDELGSSLLSGGIDAGTAWIPAKALQVAGTAVGAATGRMTKEGTKAIEIENAAKRLGLPTPSFGQTYPSSWVSSFERASPAHAKLVEEQAEALFNVMKKDTKYGVPDAGGAYLDELKKAVATRYTLGSKMYSKVDEIVQNSGIGPLQPSYAANVLKNTNNPGYQLASEEMGKYGFDASAMAGVPTKQLRQIPLSFSDYNTARVAVNKAYGNISRSLDNAQFVGNAPSAELKAARSYLKDLRDALDSDAARWAKQNAGNKEALDAFKEANAYWKEQVVPTVIDNPFARKVASARRGFPTGERATSLSLSTANSPLVDRLLPTMSGRGADTTVLLRNLPEVRAKALTDEAVQTPRGPLHALTQVAEGRRDTGALEKLFANIPVLAPAVRGAANLRPVRRLAGAQDLMTGLPRAAAYSTALPLAQDELQDAGANTLGLRGR